MMTVDDIVSLTVMAYLSHFIHYLAIEHADVLEDLVSWSAAWT